MRVMGLLNWPPGGSGAFDPHNPRFAVSSEEVLIEKVTRINGKKITFVCTLEGKARTYDFSAPDERVAEELKTILENNAGLSLFSVGTIEIPPELS
jgi:hypothetical protein